MADYRLAFAQWLREKENFHAAGYILDLLDNAKLSTPSNPNLPSQLAEAYTRAADMDLQKYPEPQGYVELHVVTQSGTPGKVIIWFGWSKEHASILSIYSPDTPVQEALTASGVRPIYLKWGEKVQEIKFSPEQFIEEYAVKPVQKKGPPLKLIGGVIVAIGVIAFIVIYVLPLIPGQ